jgi:hypothetical protein
MKTPYLGAHQTGSSSGRYNRHSLFERFLLRSFMEEAPPKILYRYRSFDGEFGRHLLKMRS